MNFRFYLSALLLLALSFAGYAAERVLVLDIDEEIDATAWRHTHRAMEQLREAHYDLLIVKLNTYGGAVDMADSIRTALRRCPVGTVAFIDHNAASAGALIALACDSAFMAPGSSIGAATVVNGQGEPMPPKYQSYWSTVMRSTAASHGKYLAEGDSVLRWRRDPALAAEMVNPDKAVSFTTDEAIADGLADGVARSIPEVLDRLSMSDAEVVYFQPSLTDRLLGFLASAGVRAVLIMLILGGIYMEMHTPGMGFAAAVATVAAVLYFLPMVVTGTLAAWVVITFVIGVVLLALEVFVIPGFGVAGIAGIVAVMASLLGAMIHAGDIGSFDPEVLWRPASVLAAGILLSGAAVWLLTSRFGPRRLRRATALTHEQHVEDGYIGVDPALPQYIGRQAVAATDLRPAGKVNVDGELLDAASTGAFIPAGTIVKIVRCEAAQVYVENL